MTPTSPIATDSTATMVTVHCIMTVRLSRRTETFHLPVSLFGGCCCVPQMLNCAFDWHAGSAKRFNAFTEEKKYAWFQSNVFDERTMEFGTEDDAVCNATYNARVYSSFNDSKCGTQFYNHEEFQDIFPCAAMVSNWMLHRNHYVSRVIALSMQNLNYFRC